MCFLAFGLKVISTFTLVTWFPPCRTFLSVFLMFITTKITANFHTVIVLLGMSAASFRFLIARDSWIEFLSHFVHFCCWIGGVRVVFKLLNLLSRLFISPTDFHSFLEGQAINPQGVTLGVFRLQ